MYFLARYIGFSAFSFYVLLASSWPVFSAGSAASLNLVPYLLIRSVYALAIRTFHRYKLCQVHKAVSTTS